MVRSIQSVSLLLILFSLSFSSGHSIPLAGPYLQSMTSERVTIMWETENPSLGTVEYGKDQLLHTAQEVEAATTHKVHLPDLQPSTLYAYRCRWEEHLTETFTFRTPPKELSRPLRIALLGKTHNQPEVTRTISDLIMSHQPDLLLHTGNLLTNPNDPTQWHEQFFQPMRSLLRSIPLFIIPGEQEQDSHSFSHYIDLPGEECYGSYDFGPVHFIILNSTQPGDPSSEQYQWLEQDLKNNFQPWTIVLFHHPLFPVSQSDISEVSQTWQPLFQKYQVPLVITGHDPYYMRSYPIGSVNHNDTQQGVYHLTTGDNGMNPDLPSNQNAAAYHANVHHWLLLEFRDTRITGTMYNLQGRRLDTFVIDPQNHISPTEFVSYEMLTMENDLRQWSQSFQTVSAEKEIVELHGKVEINNPFRIPIVGEIEWRNSDQWTIVPKKETITLATGAPLQFEFTAYTQSENIYPHPSLHLHIDDYQPQKGKQGYPLGFRNNQIVLHPFKVHKKISIEAVRAATDITLDGIPHESEWQNAKSLQNFYTDKHATVPPRNTQAFFLHNDQHLYLHINATQNPAAYYSSQFQGKNDASLKNNENVRVQLTQGDQTYVFLVTPQGETMEWARSNEDWNTDWKAAVQQYEEGWNAEIMIPKKIFSDSNERIYVDILRHDVVTKQVYVLSPSFQQEASPEKQMAELLFN